MKILWLFALSVLLVLCGFSNSIAQQAIFGPQENLKGQINSRYDEQSPVLSPDGHYLYFTRRFHPQNVGGEFDPGDIWFSKRNEHGEWDKAIRLGDFWNDDDFSSLINFSADGQRVYFLKFNRRSPDPSIKQGIFVVELIDDLWSEPRHIPIKNFYNRSGHFSVAISPDERVLILSMESVGSLGYEDLYVSFLGAEGVYTQPIHLGLPLNTNMQEMSPFLSSDGETLYFASNGLVGEGSRDIFMSKRLDNSWLRWSAPQNLGSSVNSAGVELSFYLHHADEYAYLSSTQSSVGQGDLLKVRVLNRETPLRPSGPLLATLDKTHPILASAEIESKLIEVADESQNRKVEEVVSAALVKTPPVAEKLEVVARTAIEVKEVASAKTTSLNTEKASPIPIRNIAKQVIETKLTPVYTLQLSLVDKESGRSVVGYIQIDGKEKALQTTGEGLLEYFMEGESKAQITVQSPGYKSQKLIWDASKLNEVWQIALERPEALGIINSVPLIQNLPIKSIGLNRRVVTKALPSGLFVYRLQLIDASDESFVQGIINLPKSGLSLRAEEGYFLSHSKLNESLEIEISASGYKPKSIQINPSTQLQMISLEQVGGLQQSARVQTVPSINLSGRVAERNISRVSDNSGSNRLYSIRVLDEKNEPSLTSLVTLLGNWRNPPKVEGSNGEFNFLLAADESPGRFKLSAKGYYPAIIESDAWQNESFLEIELKKIAIGEEFILTKIQFEQSSITFSDSTVIEELNRLVLMMNENLGLEILLTGYTDNQGLARDNVQLSQERADAIKKYLVEQGINEKRIESKGLGPANPIASNQNAETRRLNRRVECTIVKLEE
jgi:outer membrane protein OmpA-like peptidoglycan-associated protein